jgi:ActR/RegA family two-component response regulator
MPAFAPGDSDGTEPVKPVAKPPIPNGGSGNPAAAGDLPGSKEPGAAPVRVSKADLTSVGGANRVATSVAVAQKGWSSAEVVILAPGAAASLVDALAAAPLAGQLDAPILLTLGSEPDPQVVAELKRLGTKQIVLVGAVHPLLAEKLTAQIPGLTVTSLSGANRLETALAVARQINDPQGIFVVGYDAVADAVSAASWAAAHGYLVLPANADGSFAVPEAYKHLPGYIVGGPTLVRDIPGLTRIYGADRYETNLKLRQALPFDYSVLYTADGATLVDALTGAPLAARTGAPIVLLPGNDPAAGDFTGITAETELYSFGAR